MGAMNETYILIAAHEPAHADVLHIAAATGHEVVETTDPLEIRRHYRRAFAVLIDAECAECVADQPRRPRVFVVAPDPGPPDYQRALALHAEAACTVPSMSYDIVEALSATPARPSATGEVIGMLGACGGAGSSTLACALALSSSSPSLLVDAVPFSGGLDLLLGAEEQEGKRWADVHVEGHVPAAELRAALPHVADTAILTCDRGGVAPAPSVEDIVAIIECHRSDSSGALTVVDLPAWGDTARQLVGALDRVYLVVPAEVRAVAAGTAISRAVRTELGVVVRYRQWSGLSAHEVENLVKLPVVAEIPHVRGLAKTVETRGMRIVPRQLKAVAERLEGFRRG